MVYLASSVIEFVAGLEYSLFVEKKSSTSAQRIYEGMTDQQKRMAAEALATMHRFSPEPTFKYDKPVYKETNTVEAIAHAKSKRGK